VVGVKYLAGQLVNRLMDRGQRLAKLLLYKGFGGARGIRTLDPSCPGYRISSSC
jgi:hypothetical protein